MSKREIGVEAHLPVLQALLLILQHLFAMFGGHGADVTSPLHTSIISKYLDY